MSVQFFPLTIRDIQRQTDDAIAITFDVAEELRPVFNYKQGQYLTIRLDVDGVSHRRNYSLCSSPYWDEPLTIAVKKVGDGVVSSWLLHNAKPGDVIEAYPPMGNFTKELRPDQARHYVLFGGGSGITPLYSILKSILRVEPNSVVTLIYANRTRDAVIFRAELDALVNSHPGKLRLVHFVEEGAEGADRQGRMDEDMVAAVLNEWVPVLDTADFFVCGPTPMMDNVINVLHRKGVNDRHIHREYFTLDRNGMNPEMAADNTAATDDIVRRTVRIRLYGSEHSFDVDPDESILMAAQKADLDPPYACQIGACCTCRARLISGKVKMDEREALSDDEIAEGYILTCQSHPLTDDVVADYDQ